MKKVIQLLVTIVFIFLLPLMVIELIMKNPHHISEQIKLNFQLTLFVVDLGRQK